MIFFGNPPALKLFTKKSNVTVGLMHMQLITQVIYLHSKKDDKGVGEPFCQIDGNLIADFAIDLDCPCDDDCPTQRLRGDVLDLLIKSKGGIVMLTDANVTECEEKYMESLIDFIEAGVGYEDAKHIVTTLGSL
jgi:hypothetical protein